jgi:hypothetical protein
LVFRSSRQSNEFTSTSTLLQHVANGEQSEAELLIRFLLHEDMEALKILRDTRQRQRIELGQRLLREELINGTLGFLPVVIVMIVINYERI